MNSKFLNRLFDLEFNFKKNIHYKREAVEITEIYRNKILFNLYGDRVTRLNNICNKKFFDMFIAIYAIYKNSISNIFSINEIAEFLNHNTSKTLKSILQNSKAISLNFLLIKLFQCTNKLKSIDKKIELIYMKISLIYSFYTWVVFYMFQIIQILNLYIIQFKENITKTSVNYNGHINTSKIIKKIIRNTVKLKTYMIHYMTNSISYYSKSWRNINAMLNLASNNILNDQNYISWAFSGKKEFNSSFLLNRLRTIYADIECDLVTKGTVSSFNSREMYKIILTMHIKFSVLYYMVSINQNTIRRIRKVLNTLSIIDLFQKSIYTNSSINKLYNTNMKTLLKRYFKIKKYLQSTLIFFISYPKRILYVLGYNKLVFPLRKIKSHSNKTNILINFNDINKNSWIKSGGLKIKDLFSLALIINTKNKIINRSANHSILFVSDNEIIIIKKSIYQFRLTSKILKNTHSPDSFISFINSSNLLILIDINEFALKKYPSNSPYKIVIKYGKNIKKNSSYGSNRINPASTKKRLIYDLIIRIEQTQLEKHIKFNDFRKHTNYIKIFFLDLIKIFINKNILLINHILGFRACKLKKKLYTRKLRIKYSNIVQNLIRSSHFEGLLILRVSLGTGSLKIAAINVLSDMNKQRSNKIITISSEKWFKSLQMLLYSLGFKTKGSISISKKWNMESHYKEIKEFISYRQEGTKALRNLIWVSQTAKNLRNYNNASKKFNYYIKTPENLPSTFKTLVNKIGEHINMLRTITLIKNKSEFINAFIRDNIDLVNFDHIGSLSKFINCFEHFSATCVLIFVNLRCKIVRQLIFLSRSIEYTDAIKKIIIINSCQNIIPKLKIIFNNPTMKGYLTRNNSLIRMLGSSIFRAKVLVNNYYHNCKSFNQEKDRFESKKRFLCISYKEKEIIAHNNILTSLYIKEIILELFYSLRILGVNGKDIQIFNQKKLSDTNIYKDIKLRAMQQFLNLNSRNIFITDGAIGNKYDFIIWCKKKQTYYPIEHKILTLLLSSRTNTICFLRINNYFSAKNFIISSSLKKENRMPFLRYLSSFKILLLTDIQLITNIFLTISYYLTDYKYII
uniref:Uncharacterized protein n=1 Tax=Amorphochlora amoebiformis TaxID=1561963 RepID=A0A0H5BR13_9EUKA|nr:hypothetical protein [Amorphochlora amoebiformis]